MRPLIRLIKKTYHLVEPHESKAVLSNVAFLSGLQAISYLLPVIVLPFLFRVIGPEKFGLIAFAQAFVQYFMILTDYGFSVSATREISVYHNDKKRVSEVFSAVMTIKIILLILSLIILSILVKSVPKFQNDGLIYALSFGMVIGNTFFPVWFFQGMEQMKYIANLNIVGELFYAISIFSLIRGPQDYLLVPIINSAVFLATGLLGQYFVFRKFSVKFRIPALKSLLLEVKNGWNVFISIVAINAYTTTRIFAVGLLTNNTITGFYSIAERIANVAQTFPLTSFSQAIFPRLSKIYHRNKRLAQKIMQQIQLITVIISVICLPVIFILAPLIVKIVCGGNYQPVVLSLRLLLVGVFFIASNAFRVQYLLVSGKTDIYSRIHVLMAILGLPLVFLLIYSFSYVGAALSTVAIEAGIFTLTWFAVKRLEKT